MKSNCTVTIVAKESLCVEALYTTGIRTDDFTVLLSYVVYCNWKFWGYHHSFNTLPCYSSLAVEMGGHGPAVSHSNRTVNPSNRTIALYFFKNCT